MNAIHVFKYSKRIDMSNVNIMLLSESNSPKEDFENVLKQGWDIIILDSLADTINKIRIATDWTEKATETWVLKYMDEIRRGKNDLKKFTAFFCTQHMTKGKEYSGSTNLKHMTDAMMNLLVDEKSQTETYIEYVKNRDGKKNIRLYFTIDNNGVTFNEARFEKDNQIRAKISATRDALNKNESEFETFFLTQTSNETLDNPNPEEVVENQEIPVPVNNVQALVEENVPA
jgi:predicted ATP-dependent serine protease